MGNGHTSCRRTFGSEITGSGNSAHLSLMDGHGRLSCCMFRYRTFSPLWAWWRTAKLLARTLCSLGNASPIYTTWTSDIRPLASSTSPILAYSLDRPDPYWTTGHLPLAAQPFLAVGPGTGCVGSSVS